MRVWAYTELRAKHDQHSCYLRPPFLGTPLVPLKTAAHSANSDANAAKGVWQYYRCLWAETFQRKYMWEEKPSECQIRGWRAVSATGLQGKGLRKNTVVSQTPVSSSQSQRPSDAGADKRGRTPRPGRRGAAAVVCAYLSLSLHVCM